MQARARARFEEVLRARRAALIEQGPEKIEPNRKDASAVGVADEDEQALSEMMQSLASSRNRDIAATLAAIDRALRKLRDAPDEFGACEDCGDEIPARRLEVMPWAALCIECQQSNDPRRNVTRRKLTDFR